MVETRTGRGVTRRPGRLGHDPFAITEGETLTADHRAQMEAFYRTIDKHMIAERCPDLVSQLKWKREKVRKNRKGLGRNAR